MTSRCWFYWKTMLEVNKWSWFQPSNAWNQARNVGDSLTWKIKMEPKVMQVGSVQRISFSIGWLGKLPYPDKMVWKTHILQWLIFKRWADGKTSLPQQNGLKNSYFLQTKSPNSPMAVPSKHVLQKYICWKKDLTNLWNLWFLCFLFQVQLKWYTVIPPSQFGYQLPSLQTQGREAALEVQANRSAGGHTISGAIGWEGTTVVNRVVLPGEAIPSDLCLGHLRGDHGWVSGI